MCRTVSRLFLSRLQSRLNKGALLHNRRGMKHASWRHRRHPHKMRSEALEALKGSGLILHAGDVGLRRFTLPITVGRLEVKEDGMAGEIIELPV